MRDYITHILDMVAVVGFEPTIFCSQSKRDTKLRYTTIIINPSINANITETPIYKSF